MTTSVNWSNVTDFGQLPALANQTTGNTFWVGMLYMIWIVLILVSIGWGFEVALLTASFLAMVIGILLVYAELISWNYVLSFVGIILFLFLWIIWKSRRD
jgi:hypothetical protein